MCDGNTCVPIWLTQSLICIISPFIIQVRLPLMLAVVNSVLAYVLCIYLYYAYVLRTRILRACTLMYLLALYTSIVQFVCTSLSIIRSYFFKIICTYYCAYYASVLFFNLLFKQLFFIYVHLRFRLYNSISYGLLFALMRNFGDKL